MDFAQGIFSLQEGVCSLQERLKDQDAPIDQIMALERIQQAARNTWCRFEENPETYAGSVDVSLAGRIAEVLGFIRRRRFRLPLHQRGFADGSGISDLVFATGDGEVLEAYFMYLSAYLESYFDTGLDRWCR